MVPFCVRGYNVEGLNGHFFVFMKLLFGIDVAMCDRVHEVEPKHGPCYLLIASGNFFMKYE